MRLPACSAPLLVILLAAAAGALWAIQLWPGAEGAKGSATYEYVADIDTWQRTRRTRQVYTSYDLRPDADWAVLPLQIDGWSGEDVRDIDPAVFEVLDPDAYLSRLYARDDGRHLWLSLLSSRHGASFHPPQICYGGWQITVRSEAIPIAGGDLYAMTLFARREEKRELVYHFYLWPSQARSWEEGVVMFKVTAPLQGTEDDTRALVRSFVAAWFQGVTA